MDIWPNTRHAYAVTPEAVVAVGALIWVVLKVPGMV